MATTKNFLAKLMKRNEKKPPDEPETPLREFNAIIKFINSVAYFVGLEFISDWQFNRRAKAVLIMESMLFWLEFYTCILLFPSIDCVELSAGFMFTVTCFSKFSFFVFNHGRFMSLIDFIYEVANNNAEGRRAVILVDTTRTIYSHFKLVIGGLAFGAGVYMFYPCYDYVVNRNMTPVSPLKFPFVDDTTRRGYLISTVMNLIPPAWNIIGLAAISCIFMTFVDVYAALVSLINDDLRIFDGMWTGEHQNVNQRKLVFRNIMVEMMDLARYSAMMNELFSFLATVQIGCCFFGMTGSLFGYLVNEFYGGVGAVLYFTTELMLFCYIGQLMDNQAKRITLVIFHSEWYMYEIAYQKCMLFTLCIIQDLKPIIIADIIPLNFATGLTVVQKVYSILMFLLKALE